MSIDDVSTSPELTKALRLLLGTEKKMDTAEIRMQIENIQVAVNNVYENLVGTDHVAVRRLLGVVDGLLFNTKILLMIKMVPEEQNEQSM